MSDVTVAAPGGESIADVSTRVARARRRILSEHAGRTVLIVSHVTPIKLLLAAGLGVGDEVVHRVFLEAASLCTVTWSSDGRSSVRAGERHRPPALTAVRRLTASAGWLATASAGLAAADVGRRSTDDRTSGGRRVTAGRRR